MLDPSPRDDTRAGCWPTHGDGSRKEDSSLQFTGEPPRVVRWHRNKSLYHNLSGEASRRSVSLFENVLPPTTCSRVNDRGFPPNLSAVLERLLPENPDEDAASSYQNNSWPSLDVDADEDDAPGGHGG